jgi:hypothetical protein
MRIDLVCYVHFQAILAQSAERIHGKEQAHPVYQEYAYKLGYNLDSIRDGTSSLWKGVGG